MPRPQVFFDITIGDEPAGRIVMEVCIFYGYFHLYQHCLDLSFMKYSKCAQPIGISALITWNTGTTGNNTWTLWHFSCSMMSSPKLPRIFVRCALGRKERIDTGIPFTTKDVPSIASFPISWFKWASLCRLYIPSQQHILGRWLREWKWHWWCVHLWRKICEWEFREESLRSRNLIYGNFIFTYAPCS